MDKALLGWYDYGWNYGAGLEVFPYGLEDLNLEAFLLGNEHFRLNEEHSKETILEWIHNTKKQS